MKLAASPCVPPIRLFCADHQTFQRTRSVITTSAVIAFVVSVSRGVASLADGPTTTAQHHHRQPHRDPDLHPTLSIHTPLGSVGVIEPASERCLARLDEEAGDQRVALGAVEPLEIRATPASDIAGGDREAAESAA